MHPLSSEIMSNGFSDCAFRTTAGVELTMRFLGWGRSVIGLVSVKKMVANCWISMGFYIISPAECWFFLSSFP